MVYYTIYYSIFCIPRDRNGFCFLRILCKLFFYELVLCLYGTILSSIFGTFHVLRVHVFFHMLYILSIVLISYAIIPLSLLHVMHFLLLYRFDVVASICQLDLLLCRDHLLLQTIVWQLMGLYHLLAGYYFFLRTSIL